MPHSTPATLALALAVVVLAAAPASAQRYRNSNISTPYGTFTQSEMAAAGHNPMMAAQNKQMQQEMQMQQQMMKQQQQYAQQQKAQEKQQADFLKKNPDAAKALINAYNAKAAPKKMTRADREKAKRESGEVARTTPADPTTAPSGDTTKAATPKADPTAAKPTLPVPSSKPSLATSRKPQ